MLSKGDWFERTVRIIIIIILLPPWSPPPQTLPHRHPAGTCSGELRHVGVGPSVMCLLTYFRYACGSWMALTRSKAVGVSQTVIRLHITIPYNNKWTGLAWRYGVSCVISRRSSVRLLDSALIPDHCLNRDGTLSYQEWMRFMFTCVLWR